MDNHDISSIYNEEFFDELIRTQESSSKDVARILQKYFKPSSVIDVGCGCGIFLKALQDSGIEDIIGYDGSDKAVAKSLVPDKIKIHDLRTPLQLKRKYDLCLCMEVAEHLENIYAELLVTSLTGISDNIFFTAATPGQIGTAHINLQSYTYWIDIFAKNGFYFVEGLSNQIKEEMVSRDVIWWIVKNIMIFKKL